MMSLYDQHKDTAISLVTESVVVCTIIYFVQVHVYYKYYNKTRDSIKGALQGTV